jgi:hypothetical protein
MVFSTRSRMGYVFPLVRFAHLSPAISTNINSVTPLSSRAMNPHVLSLSLAAAVGLFIAPGISEATVYTFDVDSSSGVGAGSFTIDLPDVWPGNIGQATVIRASSFRGFYIRGDKWAAVSISLNELIEQPDNVELFGTSRKLASFKVTARGIGITPVEAVDNLPGVTCRSVSVTRRGVRHHDSGPWRDTAADTFQQILFAERQGEERSRFPSFLRGHFFSCFRNFVRARELFVV